MKLTSQTTFLYVDDMQEARRFFDDIMGFEVVYDPIWACVWRTGENSFLGVVDNKSQRGLIQDREKGGVLVSFTVRDIEDTYLYMGQQSCIPYLSPIRFVEDIGLKSFVFQGPEGYLFEVQEFTNVELQNLF